MKAPEDRAPGSGPVHWPMDTAQVHLPHTNFNNSNTDDWSECLYFRVQRSSNPHLLRWRHFPGPGCEAQRSRPQKRWRASFKISSLSRKLSNTLHIRIESRALSNPPFNVTPLRELPNPARLVIMVTCPTPRGCVFVSGVVLCTLKYMSAMGIFCGYVRAVNGRSLAKKAKTQTTKSCFR